MRSGGVAIDFMHIEYDGGQLYLPVASVGSAALRRCGRDDAEARPHGETWQKTRSKVVREIQQVAEELLKIYAQRQALPGHAFVLDSDAGSALCRVWKRPSRSKRRPIKSERLATCSATWKPAVRWIAWSVATSATARPKWRCARRQSGARGQSKWRFAPTTVLVEQHAATFAARMKTLPITVASLSRFRRAPSSSKS